MQIADAAPTRRCEEGTEPEGEALDSIYPSLVNKTPRYLNSSTWGRIFFLTRRVHSTLFWLRTMVSDLEVLIL